MTDPIPPQRAGLPKKVVFNIVFDTEKQEVAIQGPIQQKLFALKVLSMAMGAVCDYVPPVIQPKTNGGISIPNPPTLVQ
jgi:hypothetical protein